MKDFTFFKTLYYMYIRTSELDACMEDKGQSLSLLCPVSPKEPVPACELEGGAPSDSGHCTSVHKGEEGSREGYTEDTRQNDNHGFVYEDDGRQKGECKVHDSEEAWLTSAFRTRQIS